MTAKYTGMNPDNTGTLSDADQLWQSVRDILQTPLGSRIMRRNYGSFIPDLLDMPKNDVTRMQLMSAAVIALAQWEPRIALNTINIEFLAAGRAEVQLAGLITETMESSQKTLTIGGK